MYGDVIHLLDSCQKFREERRVWLQRTEGANLAERMSRGMERSLLEFVTAVLDAQMKEEEPQEP